MGPATIIVMGLVGVLVVFGVLVMGAAGGKSRPGAKGKSKCPAPGCGCMNRTDADFCARCGVKLR